MAETIEVKVPDIGDSDDVEVVEVLVAVGDTVEVEQSLITLESDKASMEVPSPAAGTVSRLEVSPGDKVAQGASILLLAAEGSEPQTTPRMRDRVLTEPDARHAAELPYASPSVRKLARDKGVELVGLRGSGRNGRILPQDVERAAQPDTESGVTVPRMPHIDFSQFGETEIVPLTRINRLTAENLHRSWLHVPHVTQHDEADITELDAFRKAHRAEAEQRGFKLTFVAFLLAATAAALRQFPRFNSSLDPGGEQLVLKRYINIGIAVDTPKGLVVPVIRDVDTKCIFELAAELAEVSERARSAKLTLTDIQGGTFTISSLGGIGGTAFTPIVNAPEVAILGVSRSRMQPVWRDDEFQPRFMLPLSLSYDHRVIDGAAAARFTTHLARLLGDLRTILL